jgi:actin related protein 2/3 complex subunit 3
LQCPSRNEAQKSLATLAVSSFDIPGDSGFPLNNFMAKPSNRGESGGCGLRSGSVEFSLVLAIDQLRQYFTQLRQEIGQRLVEKVFGGEDKPSKVHYFKHAVTIATLVHVVGLCFILRGAGRK